MLRNIPELISPDLMYILMSMGHGDEILFADADFPGGDNSRRLIRLDGQKIEPLLLAVLPFFPLDPFVDKAVAAMDCSPWSDEPESYERYRRVIRRFDDKFTDFELVGRFDFYERAKKAFAVVITSETDGNILLKKGPVM